MTRKKPDLTTLLFLTYLTVIIVLMIYKSISLTPDRLFLIFLLGAIVLKKTKSFLKDWVPFIGLLLSYEVLRGFADAINTKVNFYPMIIWEEKIFGILPTIQLQHALYQPNVVHWYDVLFMLVYFMHFVYPLLIGLYFWFNNRGYYKKFVISLLLISFSAFIFFVSFPTAPPWLASEKGYIPEVHKIINETLNKTNANHSVSTFYQKLNPNPVAAFPSLHSGYVTLTLLILFDYSLVAGLLFLPFPIALWFGVIYLGEHYVVDIMAGAILALFCYLVVFKSNQLQYLWQKLSQFLTKNKTPTKLDSLN